MNVEDAARWWLDNPWVDFVAAFILSLFATSVALLLSVAQSVVFEVVNELRRILSPVKHD